jgi:hypothetical protein
MLSGWFYCPKILEEAQNGGTEDHGVHGGNKSS